MVKKNLGLSSKPFMVIIIFITMLFLQIYPIIIKAQSDKFKIEDKGNEVEIAYFKSGLEEFRVVINKNGGISQVLIHQIPYLGPCGIRIAADIVEHQTTYSDVVEPPVIRESDDGSYVEARFYGKYRDIEVYFKTNYTISKTGLILVSLLTEAKRDELSITQTTWSTHYPVNIFKNEKIRIGLDSEIKEYVLPENVASGAIFNTQAPVYWIDLSKGAEGITLINMAPGSDIFYETTVSDQRQYGRGDFYGAFFIHHASGQGAMPRGTKRLSKVALYLHGPGGYEGNREVIDLVSALARVRVQCEKAMSKYEKDSEAWNLALQAMSKIDSGIEKLIKGDLSSSKTELESARNLLSSIKEAEIGIPLSIIGLVIVIVIILIVLISRRFKKSQK